MLLGKTEFSIGMPNLMVLFRYVIQMSCEAPATGLCREVTNP